MSNANHQDKAIYAILADNVYWDVREGGTTARQQENSNWTPIPSDWTLLDEMRDEPSGFTARAFQKGTEIVISYAGTNPQKDVPDYIADINMGLGVASQQANLAAEFYHKIKDKISNETIKFTGHSLGGGLAGIMGVWFDKEAIVFDHAPFKRALTNMGEVNVPDDKILALLGAVNLTATAATIPFPIIQAPVKAAVAMGTNGAILYNTLADSTHEGVKEHLIERGIALDTKFSDYDPDVDFNARSSKITAIAVEGEFLDKYGVLAADLIAKNDYILDGETSLGFMDKHSQVLLASGLLDENFEKYATYENDNGANKDTLKLIFDSNIYGHAPYSNEQNFLIKLLRSHTASVMADGAKDYGTGDTSGTEVSSSNHSLLMSFGNTLKTLAEGFKPLDMTGKYQKAGYDALIANAIEWHYHQDIAKFDGKDFVVNSNNTLQFTTAIADELTNTDQRQVRSYGQKWITEAYAEVGGFHQISDGQYFDQWNVALNNSNANALNPEKSQILITLGNGATFVAGEQNDLLFGYHGSDTLRGENGKDTIYGGTGSDTLYGGFGDDTLKGGFGKDVYEFKANEGHDVIDDEDGNGLINIEGIGLKAGEKIKGNSWYSEDKSYIIQANKLSDNDNYVLTITKDNEFSSSITVQDWKQGDLGITLEGLGHTDEITNNDMIMGHDEGNIIFDQKNVNSLAGNDWVFSTREDDVIISGSGVDVVATGSGNDIIDSGDDNDLIFSGADKDTIHSGSGNDVIFSSSRLRWTDWTGENEITKDMLVKGSGAKQELRTYSNNIGWNVLYDNVEETPYNRAYYMQEGYHNLPYIKAYYVATTQKNKPQRTFFYDTDAITNYGEGYQGSDLVYAGAGDDIVAGSLDGDTFYGEDGKDSLFGLYGNDSLYGGDGADSLYGGNGLDMLIGGNDSDSLSGGIDNDKLYGGNGNDELHGDIGILLTTGLFPESAPLDRFGDDYLDGESGNDELSGDFGDDTLHGGDGDDKLWGDFYLLPEKHGNDHLDGGEGNDILWGQAGNDKLYGGNGNDELQGDSLELKEEYHGNDHLESGAGDDALFGYGGNDVLYGGEGDDRLFGDYTDLDDQYHGNDNLHGGDGKDFLYSGKGQDKLIGGLGMDTYQFALSDLLSTTDIKTIVDEDNQGVIIVDDMSWSGKTWEQDVNEVNIYHDNQGNTLTKQGDDYLITSSNFAGSITLDTGLDGNGKLLGMTLKAAEIPQKPDVPDTDVKPPVVVNKAPEVDTLFGDKTLLANTAFNYILDDALFKDADNDQLEYDVVATSGELSGIEFNKETKTLTGIAPNKGTFAFDIIAKDPKGASIKQSFNLTVNQAPILSSSLPVLSLMSNETSKELANIETLFNDPEGDKLTYSIQAPTGIRLDESGKLYADGAVLGVGNHSFTLTATDSLGQSISTTSTLNVEAKVEPPKEPQTPPTNPIQIDPTPVRPIPYKPEAKGGNQFGGIGNDTLEGNNLANTLSGNFGNDTLIGHWGNDTLEGGLGRDTLIGGKDNDTLLGGLGNDTYIYTKGDGRDTITDAGGKDTLKLNNLTLSDLGFTKSGDDLNILIKNTTDSITIDGYFEKASSGRGFFGKLMNNINSKVNSNTIENIDIDGQTLHYQEVQKLVIENHQGVI